MPEYNGDDIPTNDSHLGGDKKLSRPYSLVRSKAIVATQGKKVPSFISPRAASFLLFWVFVALTLLIYWKWARSDGVHYAKSTGQEVKSTPVKANAETKNLVSSQAIRKKTISRDTDRSKKVRQARNVKKDKKSIRKGMNTSVTVKNVRALRTKAAKLAREGKWSEAAGVAEQIVHKCPRTIKDRRFLGLCLFKTSQYQRGIYELEMILKYGHSDAVVEHYLGFAYYKVGSFDKALSAYKRAIHIDPANPRHYKSGAHLIVEVYRVQSRFHRYLPLAKTWYERAIALGTYPSKLANVKRALDINSRLAYRTN